MLTNNFSLLQRTHQITMPVTYSADTLKMQSVTRRAVYFFLQNVAASIR